MRAKTNPMRISCCSHSECSSSVFVLTVRGRHDGERCGYTGDALVLFTYETAYTHYNVNGSGLFRCIISGIRVLYSAIKASRERSR